MTDHDTSNVFPARLALLVMSIAAEALADDYGSDLATHVQGATPDKWDKGFVRYELEALLRSDSAGLKLQANKALDDMSKLGL